MMLFVLCKEQRLSPRTRKSVTTITYVDSGEFHLVE